MKQFHWLSIAVATIGLAWCIVVSTRIWITPVRFSGIEWKMGSTGGSVLERVEYRSFSEISGWGIVPLVVPVLMAGWATWAAWRRRTRGLALATLLFLTFCFISGFSIGGAYVPIGLGLVAATLLGMLSRVTIRNRNTAV